MQPGAYHPRDTPGTVLSTLLRDHLDDFVERVQEAADAGLPVFVERQLRAMVDCGDLTRGFIRLACTDCRTPRAVPLSCKTRLCPSCGGRRMAEQAAHLVDRVLPRAPYRQWVLTLPHDLAWATAFDATLCTRVFALFAQEVARYQCSRARSRGIRAPASGSIVEVQRFADGARCWPHAHLLAPDGVFYETDAGALRFHGLGPPRDADIVTLVRRVTDRVARLLARWTSDSPARVLLQCAAMPPSEHVRRAPLNKPSPRAPRLRKPLCARSPEGLEVHAAVHVRAADRTGLERLCRYLMRPAIPEDRLRRLEDGRIELRLKRTWKGGVTALVFEPHQLIARLAALIPRPRIPMTRYFGVFASRHSWRARVVPQPPAPARTGVPTAPKRPARMRWPDLMQRVFRVDVLHCTACGGRLRLIAAIFAPTAVAAILAAIHAGPTAPAPYQQGRAIRGPPPDAGTTRTRGGPSRSLREG